MSARFIVGDVFDGLATLDDGSVDLVVTSPPFLALRSYLPADHPDKDKEIGSEATPAAFLDVLLAVTAELRRVLAPHGSICIELGDTYAGGWIGESTPIDDRLNAEGGPRIQDRRRTSHAARNKLRDSNTRGWPLPKSKALIPELYRIALAYGINPLTGQESPAGRWRVRNNVTWCRPNPPVGALGDKWRPATSDIVIACTSDKRYWDDIATRRPLSERRKADSENVQQAHGKNGQEDKGDTSWHTLGRYDPAQSSGAPLLDYWEIPPGGYSGSHYAVFPTALVEPLVKAMAPPKVCRTCGEPSRRIVETTNAVGKAVGRKAWMNGTEGIGAGHSGAISVEANDSSVPDVAEKVTVGWSECPCPDPVTPSVYDGIEEPGSSRPSAVLGNGSMGNTPGSSASKWRPALILDCFAGSGTTLLVATGHGHDAVGIDLDARNYGLALDRVGPLLLSAAEGVSP